MPYSPMHLFSKSPRVASSILALLVALFFVGCGDSREDFVVTNPNVNNGTTGALTFNFTLANPQTTFEAPAGTTNVRFQLFTGVNGTGTLNDTRTVPFATSITLGEVSNAVQSTVVTFLNNSNIPVGRTVVSTPVTAGQNVTVNFSGANTTVPSFDALVVTPATLTLDVPQTSQLAVSGSFGNGDNVNFPSNTTAGVTYSVVPAGIVTVSTTGLVTAVAPGNAVITASLTANGVTRTDTVAVTVPVSTQADFDTFINGSVNGQMGWVSTGSFDQEIVDVARTEAAFANFGDKAFRISNAVTSNSFGDQTYSAPAAVPAGEVDATPAGARNNRYEVSFDFATTSVNQQAGLNVTLSPDDGVGSRMSFLRLEDRADGLAVVFVDYTRANPGPGDPTFAFEDIATGLSRTAPHNVRLLFTPVDGPGTTAANDIVEVFVDGVLVHTGTSWEDYWRFHSEVLGSPSPSPTPRLVDRLLFRVNGTAVPLNDGNGFLFSNVRVATFNVNP